MTRQHFEALAYSLRVARRALNHETGATLDQWRACVVAVADACYAANGRFDRGRFYRAAGLDQ